MGLGWTITNRNECWKCKNLQRKELSSSTNEITYNVWCDINDMESKEECKHFDKIEK